VQLIEQESGMTNPDFSSWFVQFLQHNSEIGIIT
jgi:hypothetical protein